MKNLPILVALLLFFSNPSYAQDKKFEKKMAKAESLVKKEKYDDAAKEMEEIVQDYPESGKAWNLFVQIRHDQIDQAKKTQESSGNLFENMTITVTGPDGKEKGDDSLANQLMSLFKNFSPVKTAESSFFHTCRMATISTDEAYYASFYLRLYKADVTPDTNVNKKALKSFMEAEDEFQKQNYATAAKLYQKAIDRDSTFYKAQLYLGDCYFFLEYYDQAIEAFKKAKEKAPSLIEPRKYLTDAYYKNKLFDYAVNEAIASFTVYPDLSMVVKLDDAAYMLDKKFIAEWTVRPVFPNSLKPKDLHQPGDLKDPVAPENSSWNAYVAALEKAKPYCNKEGIFTESNSLTKSKYLEVYSWEEMLKKAPAEEFQLARRMQEKGFLDCYVMITCFHHDFYEQYLDFASKNKQLIEAYLKICLESI